ncbi:MAG: Heavy metal efflux outer membrane protein CzcC family [Labilithrix sp.]|nr:Heavy metal efflux outer membrane protein CzcC family [Labilithrix sp.]
MRAMRRSLVVALLLLLAAPASAQTARPAPATGAAPAARPVPAAPPTVANGQAQAAVDLPAPPEVNDPMLTPVPRARTEITTWEEALQYVRARSTDLRIAAANVARAEAQQRVALAGALPSLNAQGTYTHNLITKDVLQPTGFDITNGVQYQSFTTPPGDYVSGSITAAQPVLALRAWYNIGTAAVARDASKLSFDDAKRLIALSVANAIVGVVTSERIAELNRVGLRNALARLELTIRKTALGGATGLDVVRARQDVEITRATLVTGDETLRQARETLGIALGSPEGVGVPPNVDISGLERDAQSSCKPAGSVEDRPDVAALRTRADVARRLVNDVKLQFVPTIGVQSTAATISVQQSVSPATTWNVQAVLSVPLWEGGARYGNLRDTRAQEDIALQNLEASRRTATVEVNRARRGVMVAESSRQVASAARDLAAETDRLTRLAYQEGRGTSLELVTAAQSLRESEIQLALRDFDLVRARVLAVLSLATCPW